MKPAKTVRTALVALAALAILLAAGLVALYAVDRRKAPTTPTDLVPTSWEASRTMPMHALHIGKGKVACNDCHEKGFGEKPSESTCARCHEGSSKRAHRGNERAPTTCLTCHAFAAGKSTPSCVDCHAKAIAPTPASEPARAAHELARHVSREAACSACHAAHGEKGKTRSVLPDCTACHTTVSAKHGGVSLSHARDPDGPDAGADSLDAAVARFAADARAAPALREAGVEDQAGKMCTTCHAPHSDAKDAKNGCATCHAGQRPALNAAKHAACTTCHAPHQPGAARGSCRGCHADVHVVAESKVPSHASCESCHDPHRPDASPALACVRCHESVSPKHPAFETKKGTTSACVGCHSPHGSAPATAAHPTSAAACSTCHTKAKDERAFHARGKTACTACHTTHAFAAVTVEGPATCARCHAAEAKRVEARAGHTNCTSCHGPTHAPAKNPACSTCHAQEAATAQRGHTACGSCHESHSGALGKHAECTSCHSEKTAASKALHASLPSGCATCHRPHGPKGPAAPPACATCHTSDKLSGLHSVSAHAARCASCHDSHGPPRSDRATCTTSCHAGRKDHQPEAKVCKGCHMFRR